MFGWPESGQQEPLEPFGISTGNPPRLPSVRLSFLGFIMYTFPMAQRKVRFFNTTGPCNPDYHYMLPPEERLVGAEGLKIPLHRYIRDQLYWVLHAPRQTGKTTFLQSWMREINSGDEAIACYVSVEACQGIAEPERAMPAICDAIRQYASNARLPVPESGEVSPVLILSNTLKNWAKLAAPKPLVVLFDETDILVEGTLISFLGSFREASRIAV
jgi:hypothetical protein